VAASSPRGRHATRIAPCINDQTIVGLSVWIEELRQRLHKGRKTLDQRCLKLIEYRIAAGSVGRTRSRNPLDAESVQWLSPPVVAMVWVRGFEPPRRRPNRHWTLRGIAPTACADQLSQAWAHTYARFTVHL
jgi:hypothetical protein